MSTKAKLTQRDRVLAALRRAGRRGVTPIDFQAPHVVDGGTPIIRLASRILELRERGYRIDSRRDAGVARYVLVEEGKPRHARAPRPRSAEPPAQLELPSPATSPFDPTSEWA